MPAGPSGASRREGVPEVALVLENDAVDAVIGCPDLEYRRVRLERAALAGVADRVPGRSKRT